MFSLYGIQGVKLRLQSTISMQNISNGELLVLVPFTKNASTSNRTPKCDQPKTSVNVKNVNSVSNFADLAWNEMMQDLSSLHDSAKTVDKNAETSNSNVEDREEEIAGTACSSFSQSKRKRGNEDCGNGGKKVKKSCATSSSHSNPKTCHVGLNSQFAAKLVLL